MQRPLGFDDDERGDEGGGSDVSLSRLVNLPFYARRHHGAARDSSSMSMILPGPFVVLQGSPGDGMANTIDSMPVLPSPPPLSPAAASVGVVASGGDAGGGGNGRTRRRNSATGVRDRIPDRVLEEPDDGSNGHGNGAVDERSHSASNLKSENDNGDHAASNHGKLCRPRSDSDTEGGLHLPLGTTSPLMRQAHRGAAGALLADDFLAGGGCYSPTTSARERSSGGLAGVMAPPLATNRDDAAEGASESSLLKRRSERQNNAVASEGETGGRTPPTDVTSERTPAELLAVRQWRRECRQREATHLEEGRQNVELLLQRRKRTRDRSRGRTGAVVERHGIVAGAALSSVAADGRDSPVGTATSGSSESSDNATSPSARQTDVAAALAAAATAKGRTGADPLDDTQHALDLAEGHREWYQRDGRLVVFESLPYASPRGVVARPVVAKSAPMHGDFVASDLDGTVGDETSLSRSQNTHTNDEIVTLAPGCTVMAESAFVLDSQTLRQLHPPVPKTRSHAPFDESSPKLTFLKITSPHCGYVLSSIHSYPLLLPGLPTTYTQTDEWLWRVTCQPDGAFIRRGLELVTDHLGTLPYGTVCRVKRKVVNGMGLNRLRIEAHLPKDVAGDDEGPCRSDASNEGRAAPEDAFGTTERRGYISEFLNPLSGQRGNVVEPVSFPVPALYRVVHPKGCVIRSGVELSTSQIGYAPLDAVLSVVGRSYSDHPGHNCLERLRLAGGGGWISMTLNRRPPGNETLVEMVGVDGSFDPNDPARFHFESVRRVTEELRANDGIAGSDARGGDNRQSFRRLSSYADLSEIGDDDALVQRRLSTISSPGGDDDVVVASLRAPMSNAAVPALFRSGVVRGGPSAGAMDAIRESSSDAKRRDHHGSESSGSNSNRCLICLSDERTATIVHGETGHIVCCLTCARILKARGDNCPVCRLPIDLVIQQFWA